MISAPVALDGAMMLGIIRSSFQDKPALEGEPPPFSMVERN
jgi:hypothetical protein